MTAIDHPQPDPRIEPAAPTLWRKRSDGAAAESSALLRVIIEQITYGGVDFIIWTWAERASGEPQHTPLIDEASDFFARYEPIGAPS